jgi:hypothetical protein
VMAEIKLVRSDEPQRNKTDYYRHDAQRYSGDRGSTFVGFTACDTGPRSQASRQRGKSEEEANDKPAGSDGDPAENQRDDAEPIAMRAGDRAVSGPRRRWHRGPIIRLAHGGRLYPDGSGYIPKLTDLCRDARPLRPTKTRPPTA